MLDDIATSKKWIENCAAQFGLSYQELMDGVKEWRENDRSLDIHWDYDEQEGRGCRIYPITPDDLWHHYEIVMKTKLDKEVKKDFFNCRC